MDAFFLLQLVERVFFLLYIFILIRIFSAWFPLPNSKLLRDSLRIVHQVTEPILKPFRGLIPIVRAGAVGIDISPIIAIFVLQILESILKNLIVQFFM